MTDSMQPPVHGVPPQGWQPPAWMPPQVKPPATSRWAWGIAISPLLYLLGALTASGAGASASAANLIGLAAMWALAITCSTMDRKDLAAAGVARTGGFVWTCLLGGWLYLLVRAVKMKTGKGWAIFATGAVLWLAAVLVTVPLTGSGSSTAGCNDSSCVVSEVTQTMVGSAVKDNSVITGMTCQPGTVKHNAGGTWTVDCTASYSDGSEWNGYASIVVATNEVYWEVTSQIGGN